MYEFLDQVTSDNILIYRFSPHGSKKLDHCLPLKLYYTQMTPDEQAFIPNLIFHDQEPLCHELYDPSEELSQWIEDNHVNEGDTGLPYWTQEMTNYLSKQNLKVVIKPVFRSVFDNVLLVHSEKNSPQVEWYENNGFIGVYYWSHALIAKDWYRYAEVDPALSYKHYFEKDFVVYGRAWTGTREYRIRFFDRIMDYEGLSNRCIGRFSTKENGVHYTQHKFKNNAFKPFNSNLANRFYSNVSDPWASATYSVEDYQAAGIDVVLETLFDDTRIQLTEKILRPIACGKPFIIASTRGSLQYLRDYGFKTFGDFIDESYDDIQDPLKRLYAIVESMRKFSLLSDDKKQLAFEKMYTIAQENKKHFFSKKFFNSVIDEYKRNFNVAMYKLWQTRNATDSKFWQKIYSSNDISLEWLDNNPEECKQLLEYINSSRQIP